MTSTTRYTLAPVGGGKNVAVLTMDSPPVNSLSKGTRAGLVEGVAKAQADASVVGIIVRGAGRAFCAGAEITEFAGAGGSIKEEPLDVTIGRLEKAKIPTLALVHGFALGGGMEVSLGCHYRVATKDASFGLPEVNLGLLPGAGGTQRLPRIIGAVPSAKLILSGAHVRAAAALKMGVVDAVIEEKEEQARLDAAIKFLLAKNGATNPVCDRPIPDAKSPDLNANLDAALKEAMARRRGEIAPGHIVACVRAAVALPTFAAGMKEEGRLFGQLLASPEARALQHLFFAERAAQKLPKEYNVKPRALKQIGIVGAGLMGGGIAMSCADNGLSVVLLDVKQEFLDRGMAVITKNYERSRSVTEEQRKKRLALIKPTLNYSDLSNCDLVVEAVFEDMAIKKDIFTKLDAVCKPGCVLSSNTSGLDIDEIANFTKRPQDVVGCHFFSPANVMKLLENVRGKASSPEAVSTAMDFGKRIGKVAVLVGNCPGFVGNRMLGPYQREAEALVLEGASPQRVDAVARNLIGMNMGPLAMNDLVGLELFWRQRVKAGTADPKRSIVDALCSAGRYGQKNNLGYYKYEDGGRNAKPDPEVEKIIAEVASNLGIYRRSADKLTDNEIFERLLLPLVNEGFKVLDENMASRSSDIDVVYAFGYGFPKYRAGPMKWAEEVGADTVLAGLNKYRRAGNKNEYFVPAKGLVAKVQKMIEAQAKSAKL